MREFLFGPILQNLKIKKKNKIIKQFKINIKRNSRKKNK